LGFGPAPAGRGPFCLGGQMAKRLAIQGLGKPRNRQESARDFDKTKRDDFIETLTESCNVKYSAEQAGVAVSTVYRRRAADATFRARWDQAISVGYSQLEMMMLERALHGVEKPAPARTGSEGVMRHYDDRTALALLKQHREIAVAAAGRTQVNRTEHEEACERILARLARLKERLDGSIETKSVLRYGASPGSSPGPDEPTRLSPGQAAQLITQDERLDLVRWALGRTR